MKAQCFEDIIDGYFPLKESLKQMLSRFQSSAAWINFRFSPLINKEHLKPSDPIPIQVDGFRTGLIHEASILVVSKDGEAILTGVADWSWHDSERQADTELSPFHRLAEPVLVRGCLLEGEIGSLLGNFKNISSEKSNRSNDAFCLISNSEKDRISIKISADFGHITRGKTWIIAGSNHYKTYTSAQQKRGHALSIDACIKSNFSNENFLELMLHDK